MLDVYAGDEEPCNIGTTNRVGYCLQGKLHNGFDDAEADESCCVTWDFGEMDEQPDSLDLYDWQCESDDTTCTLYFTDYIKELCYDCGYLQKGFPWWIEIDWEKNGRKLQSGLYRDRAVRQNVLRLLRDFALSLCVKR